VNNAIAAIGAGGVSALIFMAPFWSGALGVLLMYLAPLPLLAAGLGLGSQSVLIAAASGLVTVALIGGSVSTGGVAILGVYAGLHALPACLMIYQALMKKRAGSPEDPEAWFPVGSILASVTVMGALGAIGVALGLGAGIEENLRGLLSSAINIAAPSLQITDQTMLLDTLAPSFLGVSVSVWVVMMVINGTLAQSLLARKNRSIRPRPTWSALTLPDWIAWPLVACAAVALLADGDFDYVARNLVIILATPFFFLGLAVTHALLANVGYRAFALGAVYASLVLFFLFAAGILAALGIAEQWAGVRSRFSRT
jgi:hypothetical protein